MRAENRHYTKKWKKKRKDHDGDKCKVAKCPICSYHKRYGGNSSKFDTKGLKKLKEILKQNNSK